MQERAGTPGQIPHKTRGFSALGVGVKPGKAAAVYWGRCIPNPAVSILVSLRFGSKFWEREVIPAEAVREQAVVPAQAAQKLCCHKFYYYGLLCLLLFLSISRLYCIKKFPYSSFMQQKLSQSYISERNWAFFQTLPGSPCSGGAESGKQQLF